MSAIGWSFAVEAILVFLVFLVALAWVTLIDREDARRRARRAPVVLGRDCEIPRAVAIPAKWRRGR